MNKLYALHFSTMALKTVLFICLLAIPFFAYSDDDYHEGYDVIQHLRKKVVFLTVKLNEKEKECRKNGKSNRIKNLSDEELKVINISREQLTPLLIYLEMRNEKLCHYNETANLVYAWGELYSVQEEYGKTEKDFIDAYRIYLDIDPVYLYLLVNYEKCSIEIKNYLEKRMGSKPFKIEK